MKAVDWEGTKFGRLRVQRRTGSDKHGNALWLCKCDCGNFKTVAAHHLGDTQSCGCLHREMCQRMGRANLSHGHSAGGQRTTEYRTWQGILQRCYNENDEGHWPYYGGRGIEVCDRWNPDRGGSFENFLADMGCKPAPEYSIDRVDADGDYTPNNCQWATKTQQTRNQRKFVAVPIELWEKLKPLAPSVTF